MNQLDFLLQLIILSVGLIVTIWIGWWFGLKTARSVFLYFWHALFCTIYSKYIGLYGGDALMYFKSGASFDVPFKFGTNAVIWFTGIFAYYFNFSFFVTSLIYNIIGCVGLLALDGSLKKVTRAGTKSIRLLASSVVLLPSISFWSSGIGKDAVSFAAAGMALWAAQALPRRWLLMVLAFILMLIVRPHIAAFMAIALSLSLFLHSNISYSKKMLSVAISICILAALVPFVLEYSGLGQASSSEDFSDYVEARQGHNMDGGGGINISDMIFPAQVFTYAFRPLPFEAHGISALAASVENIILLAVVVQGVLAWLRLKSMKNHNFGNISFLIFFIVFTWSILALTTSNLGISLRQKWMFMPMVLYIAIGFMATKKIKLKNHK